MKIAISQPMYMPWFGIFEQIRAVDVFVHYDDVQLPQTSGFITRVQIKTVAGIDWLVIPISHANGHFVPINESVVASDKWRKKHLTKLRCAYGKAPFFREMFDLAEAIIFNDSNNLAAINQAGLEMICRYLGINKEFVASSTLSCAGKKTDRLIEICNHFKADTYITGWGAKEYLEHERFEALGINVQYPDYKCLPYAQLHGEFTPYVSILDMIAHCGKSAVEYFDTVFIDWRKATAASRK